MARKSKSGGASAGRGTTPNKNHKNNKSNKNSNSNKKPKLTTNVSPSTAPSVTSPVVQQHPHSDKNGQKIFALACQRWNASSSVSSKSGSGGGDNNTTNDDDDVELMKYIYKAHLLLHSPCSSTNMAAARLAAEQLESTGYLERCLLPMAAAKMSKGDSSSSSARPTNNTTNTNDEDGDESGNDAWLPQWAQSVFALVSCRVQQGLGIGATSDWVGRETLVHALMRYAARLLLFLNATTTTTLSNTVQQLHKYQNVLHFLSAAFTCLDVPAVANASLPFAWLSMWTALDSFSLKRELSRRPNGVVTHWTKNPPSASAPEATLVPSVVEIALRFSSGDVAYSDADADATGATTGFQQPEQGIARVASLAVSLLTKLVGQLSTRRFTLALLQNVYTVERLVLSPLFTCGTSSAFKHAVEIFEETMRVGVDTETGDFVSFEEIESQRYDHASRLQVACFQVAETATREFSFLPISQACDTAVIRHHLSCLSHDELWSVARQLDLVIPRDAVAAVVLANDFQACSALNQQLMRATIVALNDEDNSSGGAKLLLVVLMSYVDALCKETIDGDAAASATATAAVLPTELEILTTTTGKEEKDKDAEEEEEIILTGGRVAPVRYLTVRNLAVRNWRASAWTARLIVRHQVDVALRKLMFASPSHSKYNKNNLKPKGKLQQKPKGKLQQKQKQQQQQHVHGRGREHHVVVGWAEENSSPISTLKVTKVGPVHFGNSVPAFVLAELQVSVTRTTAQEWRSNVRANDVLALIAAAPSSVAASVSSSSSSSSSTSGFKVDLIRCCRVLHLSSAGGSGAGGSQTLTWVVSLDPHTYQDDMDQLTKQSAEYAAKNIARTKQDKDGNDKKTTATAVAAGAGMTTTTTTTYNRVLGRLQLAVRCTGLRTCGGFALADRLRTVVTASDTLERQMPHWLRECIIGYGNEEEEEEEEEDAKQNKKVRHNSLLANIVKQVPRDVELCLGDVVGDWDRLCTVLESAGLGEPLVDGEDVGLGRGGGGPPYWVTLSATTTKCTSGVGEEEAEDGEDNMMVDDRATINIGLRAVVRSSTASSTSVSTSSSLSSSMDAAPSTSGMDDPVTAVLASLRPGLTVVRGGVGSRRLEVIAQVVRSLHASFGATERVLVLSQSEEVLESVLNHVVRKEVEVSAAENDVGRGGGVSMMGEGRLLEIVRLASCSGNGRNGNGNGSMLYAGGHDLSPRGRVDAVLATRLDDLRSVTALAKSLNVQGDVGSSCDTAMRFFRQHIIIAKSVCGSGGRINAALFQHDKAAVRHVDLLMKRVEQAQAFELLLLPQQRQDFLIGHRAKVVAVTITDALLMMKKQQQSKDINSNTAVFGLGGGRFDTVVLLDAAQMTDAQALVALTLTMSMDNSSNNNNNNNTNVSANSLLRRLVLAGEPMCEFPPLPCGGGSSSGALREQSFLQRLERSGLSNIVQLSSSSTANAMPLAAAAGTALMSLLTPIDDVSMPSGAGTFGVGVGGVAACVGLGHACQFVNVQDFEGVGEKAVAQNNFCNRGEAEFVAGNYMYLRLIGYPRESILIVTPYAAQRELILEIMRMRCKSKATQFLAIPTVVTLDDAQQLTSQGITHQVVLVSLVRSSSMAGPARNVRTLAAAVVGAARACVIFGRYSILAGCPALTRMLTALVVASKEQGGTSTAATLPLRLVLGEGYSTAQVPRHGKPSTMHSVNTPQEMQLLVAQMIAMV